MQALAFWKTVVADEAGFLEQFISLLRDRGIRYCVVGGQAVNAYVEPLVSLDLDLAVAGDQLEEIERLAGNDLRIERFPHSLNLSKAGSDLRVQIQLDPRYAAFVDRSAPRQVLGLILPVASVENVLQGKVWAAMDETQRPSMRQKDFADIARLVEAFPNLRQQLPAEVAARLIV